MEQPSALLKAPLLDRATDPLMVPSRSQQLEAASDEAWARLMGHATADASDCEWISLWAAETEVPLVIGSAFLSAPWTDSWWVWTMGTLLALAPQTVLVSEQKL
jgi:hypothetical protein